MLMLTPDSYTAPAAQASRAQATVRVVRERSLPNARSGNACAVQRMVISGRMSEVCAALERMTANASAFA